MRTHRMGRMTALALAALLAACTSPQPVPVASAEPAARPETGEPAISAKADRILRRMCATLGNAKAFRFKTVIMFDDVLESGLKLQQWGSIDVAVRRPNGIRVERKTDVQHRRLFYDGKTISVLDVGHNMYGETPMPDTIDAALEAVARRFGVTVPFGDLMTSDPYAALTHGMNAGSYVGESTFRGVTYDHLVFSHEGLDWQVWVHQDERALPAKFLLTYPDRPSHPQYGGIFTDWEFGGRIDGGEFVFTPPEGAERIELVPEEQKGGR